MLEKSLTAFSRHSPSGPDPRRRRPPARRQSLMRADLAQPVSSCCPAARSRTSSGPSPSQIVVLQDDMTHATLVTQLSDDRLIAETKRLAADERSATAGLI